MHDLHAAWWSARERLEFARVRLIHFNSDPWTDLPAGAEGEVIAVMSTGSVQVVFDRPRKAVITLIPDEGDQWEVVAPPYA